MKKINNVFISLLTLSILLFISDLHSQDNFKKVAQSGMQYLKIGIDAEMVGRGEAGISAVKGLSAIFWNPAGLSFLEDKEVYFSHNSWIADISMDAAGVGINFENFGTFALSLVWMDYGTLKATSVATTTAGSNQLGYIDEGTFSPTDLALGLAYSKKISEQFSVGGQVKFLYENYGHNVVVNTNGTNESVDNIAKAVAFDLGTIYYPGYKSFAFAMSIQNFSTDIKYEEESFGTPLDF